MGKLHKLFFPKAGIFVTSDYCNPMGDVLYCYRSKREGKQRQGTSPHPRKKFRENQKKGLTSKTECAIISP